MRRASGHQLLLWGSLLASSGCLFSPASREGSPCDSDEACDPGDVCDIALGVCVPEGQASDNGTGSESSADTTAESGEGTMSGDGDSTGDGDGDGDPTTGDGDGDGDPTTGDGDGDGDPTAGDGDGDGDPTAGDGDGDPTTTGDGDGDPTAGDGDGDGDGDVCGDDTATGAETCDGADLAGQDCSGQGFDAGTLGCAADCLSYDTSGCTYVCGDDGIDPGETCDGLDLGAASCVTEGYDAGSLACLGDCSGYDPAGCSFICGNEEIAGNEVCDGGNVGGADCESQGFDTGPLACAPGCDAFDTSGCSYVCGDDGIDPGETCDGTDLGMADCQSEGFDTGTLACDAGCGAYDTSGCSYVCGDSTVDPGEGCDDGGTAPGDGCDATCQVEPGWSCAGEPSVCAENCGDGVVQAATEECDGANLDGQDCASLNFDGGTLACNAACAFDTSACFVCGDGTTNGAETCDGADVGAETCETQGFDEGTLGCVVDCNAYDTNNCTYTCGDDGIDPGETCDGIDLGGQTCLNLGFDGGDVACNLSCDDYVTTGCYECGDGVLNGMETCDTADFGGVTCQSLGYDGGFLTCSPNCDQYSAANCTYECGDDGVDPGETCDGADLNGADCISLGYDGIEDNATLTCSVTCDGYNDATVCYECGDGVKNGPEVCDASDLNGETCASLGLGDQTGGGLACNNTCAGFDSSGCSFICGNGVQAGSEECDGNDLQDFDCTSFFKNNGTLTCNPDCTFNEDMCPYCGDGVVNWTDEECDGNDLGTETCESQGFSAGAPTCESNCLYNFASCTTCGDGNVEAGEECEEPPNGDDSDGCTDTCQCTVGFSPCTVGGMPTCVDTSSDMDHCGACNNSCDANALCLVGGCSPLVLSLRYTDAADSFAGEPLAVAVDDAGNASACYRGIDGMGATQLRVFDYDRSSNTVHGSFGIPLIVGGASESCEIDVRFDGKAALVATNSGNQGSLYEDHQTPSDWDLVSPVPVWFGTQGYVRSPRVQRDVDLDMTSQYNASVVWGYSADNTSYPTVAWGLSPFDNSPNSGSGMAPGPSLRGIRFERNDAGLGYVMRDYETGVGMESAMDYVALSPADSLSTSTPLANCTMDDATGWIEQFDMRVEERTQNGWYACVFKESGAFDLHLGVLSPTSETQVDIAVLGVDPPFPRVVVQPDRDSDTDGLNGVVYINASGEISYLLAETLGGNFSPSHGGTLAVGNNVKSFDAALDANGDLLLFYSSGEGDSFDPRVVTFAEFEWQGEFMGPLPIETTDLASFVTTNSTTPLRLDATPSGRAAMLYVGSGGGVEFWAYE